MTVLTSFFSMDLVSLFNFKLVEKAYEIASLSVRLCPPLLTFKPISTFHDIQQGGRATEGDLDAIIFNVVSSNI
jgi:hypothetical protein